MAKNKVRFMYDPQKDAYRVEISTDRGRTWNMTIESTCQRCKDETPLDEPTFVSCGLINEYVHAIRIGYEPEQ